MIALGSHAHTLYASKVITQLSSRIAVYSNRITLSLTELLQDCTQWLMAGTLKTLLVYICFPTFFQPPDKCQNICVAFLENLFIEYTTHVSCGYYFTKEVLK